jgi:hypothetical protein
VPVGDGVLAGLPARPRNGTRVRPSPKQPGSPSGFDLARVVDLLMQGAASPPAEYAQRAVWEHSSISHTVPFGTITGRRRLATSHHDPGHDDFPLDRLRGDGAGAHDLPLELTAGIEGAVPAIGPDQAPIADRAATQP